MKIRIQLTLILTCFQLIPNLCYSQERSLIGTWVLKDSIEKDNLPKALKFEIFNDSLFIIPEKSDSLNSVIIIRQDSSMFLIQNTITDTINHKSKTYKCSFHLNKNGDNLKVEYILDKKNKSNLENMKKNSKLEYSFLSVCCSNHSPVDCADNANDLQKLKNKGCKGLHHP